MANGFGDLYVGSSGLKGSQNALNVVANNLSNVDTTGYVRQQVFFVDENYQKFGNASVSSKQNGLGVEIGDVIHTRDEFLDKAYRSEAGRYAFYNANYDATSEVETLLQETSGQAFSTSISDLYSAFNEFAKDPSEEEIQDLVIQRAQLFITRAQAVNDGLKDYQSNINTKIKDDVNRINELGKEIYQLNQSIQSTEAGKTETAMTLRDQRDADLDELSKLASISYKENIDGIVTVQIEGVQFVDVDKAYTIEMQTDRQTGFVTPYWNYLSDPKTNTKYQVFNTANCDPVTGHDVGEVKALLLARGTKNADYTDMLGLTAAQYEGGVTDDATGKKGAPLADSVMMNTESELDTMIHEMVLLVNNYLSPVTEASSLSYNQQLKSQVSQLEEGKWTEIDDPTGEKVTTTDKDGKTTTAVKRIQTATVKDAEGNDVTVYRDKGSKDFYLIGNGYYGGTEKIYMTENVLDEDNCAVGSDGKLPPEELFTRQSTERYHSVTVGSGTAAHTFYVFNEEDTDDPATLYTIDELEINNDLAEQPNLIPYKHQNGNIAYDVAENIYSIWEKELDGVKLNPSDTTPVTFESFYTKLVGEVATTGNIYKTTSESLEGTRDQIENSRQGVIGVNSDEELTNMIKYQNAYNASSRYINVISEMIDYLLSSLGG